MLVCVTLTLYIHAVCSMCLQYLSTQLASSSLSHEEGRKQLANLVMQQ